MKYYKIQKGLYSEFLDEEVVIPNLYLKTSSFLERKALEDIANEPITLHNPFDYFDTYYFFDEDAYPEKYQELKSKEDLYDFYTLSSTDAISRIIVSDRMKMTLEKFIICPHYFYRALLLYKQQKNMFYIFQMYYKYLSDVDFNKSIIGLSERKDKDKIIEIYDNININSTNAMELQSQMYSERNLSMKFIKLILKRKFDVFFLHGFTAGGIFVSEEVKEEIKKEGLSGISFVDCGFEIEFDD